MDKLALLLSIIFNYFIIESQQYCDCGKINSNGLKITNGKETKPHQYPFIVSINLYNSKDPYCSGSIVTEYFVLTAAHCLNNVTKDTPLWVVAGQHNWKKDDPNIVSRYKVAYFITHPNYSEQYGYTDISIVKTYNEIIFNKYVSPICLPYKFKGELFINKNVTVMGWGFNEYNKSSDSLKSANVKIISNPDCYYLSGIEMTDYDMCNYSPPKDANFGDSGGPVVYYDNTTNSLFLIGIISRGYPHTFVGYNVRVTYVLDWIDYVINTKKCIK